MTRTFAIALATLISACGDDDGSANVDAMVADTATFDMAEVDAPAGMFALTSPAFVDGATIPLAHVCAPQGGMNISPSLMWTNPPAGTMSFALVFTDIFNPAQPYLHSVMFDIPVSLTSLPENVEKAYAPTNVPGAHQTLGYNGSTRGYLGPCPNQTHTYEFALYALPTATLPGGSLSTGLMAAATMIKANNLGVAKLTGMHTPP